MRIHATLPGTALKNKKNNTSPYYIKKSTSLALRTYVLAFLRRIAQSSFFNNLSYREIFNLINYPYRVIVIA